VNTIEKNAHDLKIKTLFGLMQFIVIVGLCLFGPAWSFDFWQAWVYLIIFVVSEALITTYLWKKDPILLERRVEAGTGAEKEKTQKIIQLFAYILFLSILIIPSFDHRFGWSSVPLYMVIAGDILVALGFFIVFLALRENTFAAATIEVFTDQKVITTGPYGIVRHRMYIGGLIMLLGTPLALGSWWGLLIFIPITMIIILDFLRKKSFY
jgi:protein-S-isoprenylcysteine O-methyltransferase Ste14